MKPVFDLIGCYEMAKKDILKAIKRVLESGSYILGEEVKLFEKEFAKKTGNKYCVGVASGTDAITLSLMALGIGRGDNVIAPNFTAYPTIVGIERSGALPIVVDVKNDALIDSALVEKAITSHTRAIVPVHLFNKQCDMKALKRIASAHNLFIVEDCAQRTFTKIVGVCGAYSFYPTKMLGGYGDGGAVCTNNHAIYEKLLTLRNYGQVEKNKFVYKGLNSRLDEIQAAILRVKLKRKAFMKTPIYRSSVTRDFYIKTLKQKGIEALIHYPYTIFDQPAFDGLKHSNAIMSKLISQGIVTLPPES